MKKSNAAILRLKKQVTYEAIILNHFLRGKMSFKDFFNHIPPQKMVQNFGFERNLL